MKYNILSVKFSHNDISDTMFGLRFQITCKSTGYGLKFLLQATFSHEDQIMAKVLQKYTPVHWIWQPYEWLYIKGKNKVK